MPKLRLEDLPIKGKRVLMRVDLDVPLDERGRILDDRRVRDCAPGIRAVIAMGGTPILMGHLTRSKIRPLDMYRMGNVALVLREIFGWNRIVQTPDAGGPGSQAVLPFTTPGFVVLLENMRLDQREEQNDAGFARWLAQLGSCYVNDDFASLHLPHTSIVGVPAAMPGAAAMGAAVAHEIDMFDRLFRSPVPPFVALLGGGDYFRVEERIDLAMALLDRCSAVLVGGLLAYTFLAASGTNIGSTWIDPAPIAKAAAVLERAKQIGVPLMLPIDHVATSDKARPGTGTIARGDIPLNWTAVDIGPATAKRYAQVLSGAKTIFWYGPMGRGEHHRFAEGTREVAQAIAGSSALTYVCGSDTVQAARKAKLAASHTHFARGSGAPLLLLQGKPVPGLAALTDQPAAATASAAPPQPAAAGA
jgi:phosphoglycerate kinase